jgi:hypothetical protein
LSENFLEGVPLAPCHCCTAGHLPICSCLTCHSCTVARPSADDGQFLLGSTHFPCRSPRFLAAALRGQFSVSTPFLLRFSDRRLLWGPVVPASGFMSTEVGSPSRRASICWQAIASFLVFVVSNRIERISSRQAFIPSRSFSQLRLHSYRPVSIIPLLPVTFNCRSSYWHPSFLGRILCWHHFLPPFLPCQYFYRRSVWPHFFLVGFLWALNSISRNSIICCISILWQYNTRCTRKSIIRRGLFKFVNKFWHQIVKCWVYVTRQVTLRCLVYSEFIEHCCVTAVFMGVVGERCREFFIAA